MSKANSTTSQSTAYANEEDVGQEQSAPVVVDSVPVKLHFTRAWLRQKSQADPDVDVEAGPAFEQDTPK